jgi:DNA-binding XRE family transcriptional regulator
MDDVLVAWDDPQGNVTPEMKERARKARAEFAHKPTIEEVLGPDGLKNAIRFYFTLRSAVIALRKAREAAGLTVADVASKCGVSEEDLTKFEAGATLNYTWKLLGDYAHAVGMKLTLGVEPAE